MINIIFFKSKKLKVERKNEIPAPKLKSAKKPEGGPPGPVQYILRVNYIGGAEPFYFLILLITFVL